MLFFRMRAQQGGTAERKAMIDGDHALPVTQQARPVGISRSSAYYQSRGVSEADLKSMRRINELHLDHPFAVARMSPSDIKEPGIFGI